MFPLDVSSVKEKAMVVKAWKDYDIWHLRYGHLHLNGLKLLKNKDMVMGLPNIDDIEFCEGWVLGKQIRNLFLVGKSWRACRHLELVRADLCGLMNTESLNAEVAIAVYLLNLSPTKAVMNSTPFEAWRGVKPRVFFDIPNVDVLDGAVLAVFVTRASQSRQHELIDVDSGRISIVIVNTRVSL
nr:retrovirus-related Pol polyprotein from transposon TNT 1-94 [Tanacetum cinerariifolium]